MQRREFVRIAMAMGLAPKLLAQQGANPAPPPPAPVPWTLGLNPATPLPHTEMADVVADGELQFFSADQIAALTRLCSLLLPAAGQRPGALEAEVPAFLDFLIGRSPAERQQVYTAGLDWLNAESTTQFHEPFGQTQAAQADQLMRPWLRSWMTDHPPTEQHAAFVNIAHADIRTATMNSKVWSDAGKQGDPEASAHSLYWSPIEPDVYSEDANRVHVRPSPTVAAPKASHTSPSYPN